MDDRHPTEPPPRVALYLPDDLEAGVYANMLSTWHTGHEFTLDFAAIQRVREAGDGEVVLPSRVVTRVKVPPSAIFEMIRIMNEAMTRYEQTFGEIRLPEGSP